MDLPRRPPVGGLLGAATAASDDAVAHALQLIAAKKRKQAAVAAAAKASPVHRAVPNSSSTSGPFRTAEPAPALVQAHGAKLHAENAPPVAEVVPVCAAPPAPPAAFASSQCAALSAGSAAQPGVAVTDARGVAACASGPFEPLRVSALAATSSCCAAAAGDIIPDAPAPPLPPSRHAPPPPNPAPAAAPQDLPTTAVHPGTLGGGGQRPSGTQESGVATRNAATHGQQHPQQQQLQPLLRSAHAPSSGGTLQQSRGGGVVEGARRCHAAVRDIKNQHGLFRREVSRMLQSSGLALGALSDQVLSWARRADQRSAGARDNAARLTAVLKAAQLDVAQRDAEIAALDARLSASAEATRSLEARLSAAHNVARELRDALAEARGSVRVILKVRPTLPQDLLAASHSGVQLRALAAAWGAVPSVERPQAVTGLAAAGIVSARSRHLPLALLSLLLGWKPAGDLGGLVSALEQAAAGAASSGHGSVAEDRLITAADVSPPVLSAGSTLDDAKQFVVMPAPLSLQALMAAVTRAEQAGGGLEGALRACAETLESAVQRGTVYEFDRVYSSSSGSGEDDASEQDDLFSELRPLLEAALRGRNVTVLAYGATGSGKSHTLLGPALSKMPKAEKSGGSTGGTGAAKPSQGGVIGACLGFVGQRLQDGRNGITSSGSALCASLSMCEVYNGDCFCLCDACYEVTSAGMGAVTTSVPRASGAAATAAVAKAKVGAASRPAVVHAATPAAVSRGGVHEAVFTSAENAASIVATAAERRASAATACNARSSRSHFILRIMLRKMIPQQQIVGREFTATATATAAVPSERPLATITICDLAGNENVRESRVSATELAEARHVNASLSALADVISALVRRDTFIPFRNHILTKLLEPNMTGNARVLAIVNATALPTHREHTAQTLRFSAKMCGALGSVEPPAAAVRSALAAVRRDLTLPQ